MSWLLFLAATIVLDPGGAIRVIGWNAAASPPADYPSILSVYVEPRAEDAPSLLGTYAVDRGELVFHPRFPLRPGGAYRAVLHEPGSAAIETILTAPEAAKHPATLVEKVYPTSTDLPENLLKFYIYFSAPMSRGEAYQHIRFIDENGKTAEPPYLEIAEELWDRDARRFTLLFNPGRIKRGLVPNAEQGPPIVAGHSYTMVIDRGWQDGFGTPLGAEFRRTFHVTPSERRVVDVKTWRVTAPAVGTSRPVEIVFPRPMDRALLDHMIEVVGVRGTVTVDQQERRWTFTPDAPWKAGRYEVRVDKALEDLAGNKVDRPFDVDVFEHIDRQTSQQTKSLFFTVK